MAANDMTDALQNPHPDVPFTQIGDDTILALAELAAIFKLKLRQTPGATLRTSPLKVTQHPCLVESSNSLLASPMPLSRQTRSKTTIHTQDITNAPLPLRVITPRTLRPSPPRVPTRSRRLSPRNLSQHDLCGMDNAHMAIALGDNHWSQQHEANAVIHPITGQEMEYMALMKDPRLYTLWQREVLEMNADASSKEFETSPVLIHVFYQAHKHLDGQKDYLWQNSMRLQTSQ
jgi:hypothetical protein